MVIRIFGWSTLTFLIAFLINNYGENWLGWQRLFYEGRNLGYPSSMIIIGIYSIALFGAVFYVVKNPHSSLRNDAQKIYVINSFIIRTIFWAVLFIGLNDILLAFLRGEGFLVDIVGKEFASYLARAHFRGTYIHMPLILLAIVVASFTRTVGIIWIAALLIIAELLIVMSRFVFSYEQGYMSDLVRFWYAALLLFGSAHTLRADAHVRVDVFYTNFSPKTKGMVNAIGTLLLGMPFCWLVLIIGMSGKTGIINSALLNFEIEGLGDGMFILYLMTVFIGLSAITMLIEFVAFFFEAIADFNEATTHNKPDNI